MLVSVNAANTGLSPLARGTHILQNTRLISTRFIPAGAGNTRRLISAARDSPVYPRWRGEHTPAALDLKKGRGLSPLARGTRRDYSKEDAGDRFIPAGAGNTAPISGANPTNTVYPRWRGEHHKETILRFVQVGLSPLARGTPAVGTVKLRYCRFIPAGAGNTRC